MKRSADHGFKSFSPSAEHGFSSCGRYAEHGFSSCGRYAEHGFTLIELMVALAIFAMLSAAGVMLLSGTVSAQAQVRTRLDDMAAVQRATSLMTGDLLQAVSRVSRTRSGTFAPAFYSDPASGRDLMFVRAGHEDLSGEPNRSSLQKLEYRLVGGQLQRIAYPFVDGAAPPPPSALIDGVTAIRWRFRDEAGGWHDGWMGVAPDLLPRAVEMTLTRRGAAPFTALFLVGPGPLPQPSPTPSPSPTRG